jgi:glycosyltransferase involved in cell wall biosynthesis
MDVNGASELITIILTTLNSEKFLARSLESCLDQTYPNLELLIVDGGSTDRTLGIISSYDDPRIHIIHQKGNTGKLPGALNLGMVHAEGKFITWTQDDCWYKPCAIEVMHGFLKEHQDVALVYSDYWFVDEFEQPIRYQRVGKPEKIADGGDIIGQSFLFKREVYDLIGPQDECYFPVHEVPWRIRISQRFEIQPLHRSLMYYTVHESSLTGRIGHWQLQYMVAVSLMKEGVWDRREYRRRIAKIHMDHAYDAFVLQGDYWQFWEHLVRAAMLVPQTLSNLGTWKLMLKSFLPNRQTLRQNMLDEWRAGEAAQQRCIQKDTWDGDSADLA